MLSKRSGFKEQSLVIKIEGIAKPYFSALLQYFYTDSFRFEQPQTLCVWLNFLIYADYFML
jgi:hypothetical protein